MTDVALDLLAAMGFDPSYGARPLKRTLQRLILDPLASRMLEGQLLEGSSIRVDAEETELLFETRTSDRGWRSFGRAPVG